MSNDPHQPYHELLASLRAAGPGVADGSPEAAKAIARVEHALSDFRAPDFTDRLAAAYAPRLFFNDTLKTIKTLDALQEYLGETAETLEAGTVTFHDHVAQNGDHYLRWSMTLRLKKFAKGRSLPSIGMTHLRFDSEGQAVLHQDYWDAAGGFFQYVPVLGWMIRKIRNRL